MKQRGKLSIYEPHEVPAGCDTKTFFHQTGNLSSIAKKGWDIHHRGGGSRFFGDGVYFASEPFWEDHNGSVIEARLDLTAHRSFASSEEIKRFVATLGFNDQSNPDQPNITDYFLNSGVRCISFVEDPRTDAVFHALAGTEMRTFVVYDPSIIFVTKVRQ